jgi:hypothetical protein
MSELLVIKTVQIKSYGASVTEKNIDVPESLIKIL